MHPSSQVQETIVRLVPGGERTLSHLADDELLTSTRRLVGASNKLFAQMLLHLAEVETRGIHRTRACASLYTYCIYELRMSEDAAARRSSAALEKEKFAMTPRPRTAKHSAARGQSAALEEATAGSRPEPMPAEPENPAEPTDPTSTAPRRRGRHIPAKVKREVFAHDGGCCSYIDESGQRCGEMRYLELHHLKPFARGGEHVASNLALRCAAHNALAAEEDYGRSVVEHKRQSARHESLGAQARLELGLGRRDDC